MVTTFRSGSWFLSSFAFSQHFYQSVVHKDKPIEKVVMEWMQKYYKFLQKNAATEDLSRYSSEDDKISELIAAAQQVPMGSYIRINVRSSARRIAHVQ